MLYDKAKIWVEGGRGGHGCISFRREAHVPRGGPNGGDGGHGGDVVLFCSESRRDLGAMRSSKHFRAGKGGNGEGSNRHGARGEDTVIPVAPGTQAETVDGALVDLINSGQTAIIAHGGRGGHGNKRFATSTRQTPRFAEKGTKGESGWVELRLKLLADVGLIGLPNAGKSSLLSRLTRALPKIADYPFTTLEPILGTIDGEDRQTVVADIPGLIEGAAGGAGLGHEFLAHVERCAILIHVVDLAPLDGDPVANYETIRAELSSYGGGLDRLPELLALSKSDLITDDEAREAVAEWRGRLPDHEVILPISSATGAGLDALRMEMLRALPETPILAAGRPAEVSAGFQTEHRVYTPQGEGGYSIQQDEDGAFRIIGRGVELLFARYDLENDEALGYLEGRLTEMGVISALRKAGFHSGGELRVGDHEFEFHAGF